MTQLIAILGVREIVGDSSEPSKNVASQKKACIVILKFLKF